MKGWIGWVLALGGGYLALKYMGIDPLHYITSASSGEPVNTGGGTSTSPQAAEQNTATKQLVINAAKSAGMDVNSYQNVDTWNYFYAMVRGVNGPSPEDLFPNVNRNTKYSIDEWWHAMSGKGFSGLGAIAHYVNPYQTIMKMGFGNNLTANGSEKMIVVKGN